MANQRFRAIYGLDNNGLSITNVAAPALGTDAANKTYIDGLLTGTINIAAAQTYQINGVTVLSATALGTGVTGSSLSSVGTLTSGTLGAGFTTVAIAQGGTGQTTALTAYDALAPSTTLGDLVYFGATTSLRLAGNITAGRQFLSQTGTGAVSAAPAWTGFSTVLLSELGAPAADVAFGTRKITGLGDPTNAQDAATKAYVDAARQGLTVKDSVRVATTANITLSAPQTIDGVSVIAGQRVLVKNQSTASQNGIYVVAAGAWTRATDFDANADVTLGAFTFVQEGTTNADSGWVLTTDGAIAIGTTNLAFVQFSGAGQIVAGTGLNKSGNTLSISATYAGQATIVTVGTITSGTWNGSIVDVTRGGTGVATATANQVFAAPDGTNGAPGFRALVAADLPNTAVAAGSYGGTGATVPTFTVDAQGRLTDAGSYTISGLTSSNLAAAAGITNAQLANSQVTIGSTAVSLGGTATTIAGLTSLTATTLAGTLSTAAQGNITSLGTLTSLAITGNLTVDTNILTVDATSNSVGIGGDVSAIAAAALRVLGDIRASGTIYATDFVLTGGSTGTGLILDNLDDVVITPATGASLNGQVLRHNGSHWVNSALTTTLTTTLNGAGGGSRQGLNFIPGSNVTLLVQDNAGSNRVDVTINATGNVLSVFGETGAITSIPYLTIDSIANIDTFTLTTSATTANQAIGLLAAASYRSVKYLVQVVSGTAYQVVEILAVHDGTTVYLTEYAVIRSGASLASFDVVISAGSIRLLTTPVNAVTVYKVIATSIVV